MLTSQSTVLVMIDVQDRLFAAMQERDALLDAVSRLVRGALLLDIPVLHTEQAPQKLGPTRSEIANLLPEGLSPVTKTCFDACEEPSFLKRLDALQRRSVLVCGIEAHVCVYQTVAGMLHLGYEVEVVTDAVSSRHASNRDVALRRMESQGAGLTSVEMALFEVTRTADASVFRELQYIVK